MRFGLQSEGDTVLKRSYFLLLQGCVTFHIDSEFLGEAEGILASNDPSTELGMQT